MFYLGSQGPPNVSISGARHRIQLQQMLLVNRRYWLVLLISRESSWRRKLWGEGCSVVRGGVLNYKGRMGAGGS